MTHHGHLQPFTLLRLPLLIPILKILLEKFNPSEELALIATILLALLLGSALFKYAGLSGEIGALTFRYVNG